MGGTKITRNDSAVAEDAHSGPLLILQLSPTDGDRALRHRNLRVRKRYAVLLQAEEPASESLYCSNLADERKFLSTHDRSHRHDVVGITRVANSQPEAYANHRQQVEHWTPT